MYMCGVVGTTKTCMLYSLTVNEVPATSSAYTVWWSKAGVHKAIPPIHVKGHQHIKVISSRTEKTRKRQRKKYSKSKWAPRRDNKTKKNSVPLARACNLPNPRENELNPVAKTSTPHKLAPAPLVTSNTWRIRSDIHCCYAATTISQTKTTRPRGGLSTTADPLCAPPCVPHHLLLYTYSYNSYQYMLCGSRYSGSMYVTCKAQKYVQTM